MDNMIQKEKLFRTKAWEKLKDNIFPVGRQIKQEEYRMKISGWWQMSSSEDIGKKLSADIVNLVGHYNE